jgi:hypothetical protein
VFLVAGWISGAVRGGEHPPDLIDCQRDELGTVMVADGDGLATGLRVLPVDLVAGHPRERHPGLNRALDHAPGQFRSGGENRLIADAGLAAAVPVAAPRLARQVQLPVDQRPRPSPRNIRSF